MRRLVIVLVFAGLAIATTVAYRLLNQDMVLYRQAEERFERHEYDEAIPLYRAALKAGFVKPDLCAHLARSLLMLGRPEEAIALGEGDLKKTPDRVSTMMTLAEAYGRVGRFDDAAGLWRTLLTRYPEDRVIRIHLARALAGGGRFNEAILMYRLVLGDKP